MPDGTVEEPSAWVRRWSHLVAPGARLLDVACGRGRHLRWFAARGARVTGVDRDAAALAGLGEVGEVIVADLEAGAWPLGTRRFDAVVVTRYLWRDNLPAIAASLAPGGLLLYETFADGQARFGRPSNPAFLLRPGELLEAFATWRVIAYEDGLEPASAQAPAFCVQRIAALRPPVPDAAPPALLRDPLGVAPRGLAPGG